MATGLQVLIFALLLLMNAGCGGLTPYEKADDHSGLGYSDYHVKGNIYHVYFSGVPLKKIGVYRDYWYRRAKELCEGLGFQEYRVIEVKEDEGDPTPIEKAAASYERNDPRYRAAELVKDYSRSASVSGEVECVKKNQ
jgi:hypothetical protein